MALPTITPFQTLLKNHSRKGLTCQVSQQLPLPGIWGLRAEPLGGEALNLGSALYNPVLS